MPRRRFFKVIQWIVPTVLAAAALGKWLAWDKWVESVETFVMVPATGRQLASVVVPVLEIVPLVLGMFGSTVLGNVCASTLVAAFSIVVGVHWWNNTPPTCACLGYWQTYRSVDDSMRAWAWRNGVLITLSALACSTGGRARTSRAPDAALRSPS